MLCLQAEFTAGLGHREAARALLGESLDMVRGLEVAGQDTRSTESRIWLTMGDLQRATGRGDFRKSYVHSIALSRSVGDQWQLCLALGGLGDCDNYDGELRAARQAAEERLAILRALGDLRGIGDATNWLGWVCVRMGEVERGLELTREGARVLAEVGDQNQAVMARILFASALAYAGQYCQSLATLEQCLTDADELGNPYNALVAMGCLVWVNINLSNTDRAREHVERWHRESLELTNLFQVASCLGHQARIVLCDGEYTDAVRLQSEGIDMFERVGGQELAMVGRCWLTIALERSGDYRGALRVLMEATGWAVAHPAYYARVEAISSSAPVLLAAGDPVKAIEVVELARMHPMLANSVWHEEVVRRPIAEAAATLPPEVVAAAKERGRARDIQTTLEELLAEWD
jgi:tetratricopeptide (TPR) repeat protein